MRASFNDWNRNLATIMQWSPYSSEQELLQQVISSWPVSNFFFTFFFKDVAYCNT